MVRTNYQAGKAFTANPSWPDVNRGQGRAALGLTTRHHRTRHPHHKSVGTGEDTDLRVTVWWCVGRFPKTPSFPGNFLYGRLKNCLRLNVSLVFLSTRCASVI